MEHKFCTPCLDDNLRDCSFEISQPARCNNCQVKVNNWYTPTCEGSSHTFESYQRLQHARHEEQQACKNPAYTRKAFSVPHYCDQYNPIAPLEAQRCHNCTQDDLLEVCSSHYQGRNDDSHLQATQCDYATTKPNRCQNCDARRKAGGKPLCGWPLDNWQTEAQVEHGWLLFEEPTSEKDVEKQEETGPSTDKIVRVGSKINNRRRIDIVFPGTEAEYNSTMALLRTLFTDQNMKGKSAEALLQNRLRETFLDRLSSPKNTAINVGSLSRHLQALQGKSAATGQKKGEPSKQPPADEVSPEQACKLLARFVDNLRPFKRTERVAGMNVLDMPVEAKKAIAKRLLDIEL